MKQALLNHIVNILLLCAGAFLVVGVIYLDVAIFKNNIGEISATEILQEIVLFAVSALFFWQVKRQPALRGGMMLIGGFFGCMFIRELDAAFDLIYHGSWVYFACLLALFCIVRAAFTPKTTLRGLSAFLAHPACHYTVCGLVLVLVFSRVFGMNAIWKVVMEGEYVRAVKNIVEEGTEFMGYVLCLGATVAFIRRKEPLKTL